jgi:CHAD domain-containing protein/CYTH domain-containing protein
MPSYSPVLDLPPAQAVAAIGNALLDAARKAWTRLEDPEDTEALHDFRVALRRLRSVLRAFRPYVEPAVSRKLRRRLRDLARATNAARDSEVQLDWVQARWPRLTRRERAGSRWLATQLEERRDTGYGTSLIAIEAEFPALESRVRKRLERARRLGADEGLARSFAGAAGELVREHAAALHTHLPTIRAAGDEAEVHLARIEAKRLRYLLELLQGEVEPAGRAVQRLRGLQTLLGDLHDAQVIERQIADSCGTAAAEQARRLLEVEMNADADEQSRRAARRRNAVPGVVALTRLAREARDDLFSTFATAWRGDALQPFDRDLDAVLEECQKHAGLPLEIERKFLLAELPALAARSPAAEIEQGWLPGTKLVERLRHTRTPGGDEYFRTVKVGSGIARVELEEPAAEDVFQSLWPLTEGKRVRKRRYTVEDGGLRWEVDEFLDRNLVLAEVELPNLGLRPDLPEWLVPVVVREVTGEPAYLNVNLAL